MKDNRTKWLMIFGGLVIVTIICVVVFLAMNKGDKNDPDVPPIDNTPVTNESFDLVSYEVYDISELTFKFALVTVRIKADEAINVNLDDFTTSENFNLADNDPYISEFANYSVFLQKVGVDFNLKSEETSAVFTLFVPLLDRKATSIDLLMQSTGEHVTIDMTKNVTGTKEKLGFIIDETITDDKTFNVVVSAAIDVTGEALYQHDELFSYPSTAQLIVFKLTLTSLNGDAIVIDEAEYVTTATSDTFVALDSTYNKTEKRVNIVGVSTKTSTEGYLLFMTLNPDREQITYKGVLRVKINGTWNSVKVDL